MKSLIFLIPILLMLAIPSAIDIKKYTEKNLHIVNEIDPRESSFDDLEEIGTAIGNSRVVMLGEQCHGDGATFAAKSRLIKFLHEKKGFNVLAFEADFFTLNDYEPGNPNNNNVTEYQKQQRGINNIWSDTEECNYLLKTYIPSTHSTKNPLLISGFDNQFYGLHGSDLLNKFLKTSLNAGSFDKDISYLLNNEFYSSLDTLITSMYKSRQQLLNRSVQYTNLINSLGNKIDTLLAHSKAYHSDFKIQVLKNIGATCRQIININKNEFKSLRDSIMSENVLWLLKNKYKNEKLIIWAANSHICKQSYTISDVPYHPMGSLIEKNLKSGESYVLGFTSKQGQHGIFRSDKISKPLAKNFESWISDKVKYAFIDLKNKPVLASESFYMRAIGHGNLKMNWQSKFDGIFFIRDMLPSHRIIESK